MRLENRIVRLEVARPAVIAAEELIAAMLDESVSFERSEVMLRLTSDAELKRAIDQVTSCVEETENEA